MYFQHYCYQIPDFSPLFFALLYMLLQKDISWLAVYIVNGTGIQTFGCQTQ